MAKPELIDDHYCFACGSDNPQSLFIDWKVEGDVTTGVYTPRREHQGWKGIVHGGIIATLLDEAMTRLAWISKGGALTAEMTVRFVKTAKVGEKIYVRGEITGENRKIVLMKATLQDASGGLIAHSEGKAIKF